MRTVPLIALTLAVCGPAEQPRPDPVATQAVTVPAPEPAASPTPARIASAAPALTPDGWGPLRIGMTRVEVEAALGPDADPEAVGGPDPAQCDQFRPARAPEGMLVMIEDGRLTRVSLVKGTAIVTDRGLGPGATAAAVRDAYGDPLKAEPHTYADPPGEYLTYWPRGAPADGDRPAPDARGVRYEVDGDRRVSIVHAGGPSIQYVEGCL